MHSNYWRTSLQQIHEKYTTRANATLRLYVYISGILLSESVQRRFTKRIFGLNGLSYPQGINTLKIETLEVRRLKTDILTMFKTPHNIIAIDFTYFFISSIATDARCHRFKLVKPLSRNNARFFHVRVVEITVGTLYRKIV